MNKNDEFELEKEKIRREFDWEQEKLKYEFDLEQKRIVQEFNLKQERYYYFQQEKKINIEHLEEAELKEMLKFEGKRIETNCSVLKNQSLQQNQSLKQLRFFLATVFLAGLIALSIPIISVFREIPSILISLSIVCVFLFGIWFYTNLEKVYFIKSRNTNIGYKIEKCQFLSKYIDELLKNNARKEMTHE